MIIEKAGLHQLDALYDIIHHCRIAMENEGIFQWPQHYPNTETVAQDINSRGLYTLQKDNQYLGIITLNEEQDKAYQTISWKDANGKVAVIHRLAVHPQHQKHGFAKQLMDFAENLAAANGYTSIRLDAYTGNPRALRFYENRGYAKRGEVYFPARVLPFYCFEKGLNNENPYNI